MTCVAVEIIFLEQGEGRIQKMAGGRGVDLVASLELAMGKVLCSFVFFALLAACYFGCHFCVQCHFCGQIKIYPTGICFAQQIC